jgi:hypothetical protein
MGSVSEWCCVGVWDDRDGLRFVIWGGKGQWIDARNLARWKLRYGCLKVLGGGRESALTAFLWPPGAVIH